MSLAADLLLAVHFALAAFIAVGLAAIWLGGAFGWNWVRGCWWRSLHLAAILVIAAEAAAGIACPLTVWEDLLRGRDPEGPGFVSRWLARLLYWDLPEAAFVAIYAATAALTVLGWKVYPPRRWRN